MRKVILNISVLLTICGCGELFDIFQDGNPISNAGNNDSQNNNRPVDVYNNVNVVVSSGSVTPESQVLDNASLYTIVSNIPSIPVYNATIVNYTLMGDSNVSAVSNTSTSTDISMKQAVDNISNPEYNYNSNAMRNLMQQQLDFNRKVKENNYKPIIEKKDNSSINYKTIPDNIQIGTQWQNVYVISDPANSNVQKSISATCFDISDNVYYFLDDTVDRSQLDLKRIDTIKAEFEAGYLKVHEKCGSESDVDNNGKIVFLFTPINSSGTNDILGFFYSADRYYNADTIKEGTYSNESEIMYINSNFLNKTKIFERKKRLFIATLIHEFHHMALFDVRTRLGYAPFMDYYINEGLSTLTSYYTGYADVMRDYVEAFLGNELNLPLVNNTTNLSYGYSYLFMRYFYYRFSDAGLQKLINSQYTDYRAFEEGSGMAFNDLYKDFLKMMLVTGRNITTDSRYNVPEFNYKSGTTEYAKSYISLAEMIDFMISAPATTSNYTTDNGYSATNVQPYTFQYKKWATKPSYIHHEGTNTTLYYSLF